MGWQRATQNRNNNTFRPIYSSYFLYRKVLNILKSPSNHSLLPPPLHFKCAWTAHTTSVMLVSMMLDRIVLGVQLLGCVMINENCHSSQIICNILAIVWSTVISLLKVWEAEAVQWLLTIYMSELWLFPKHNNAVKMEKSSFAELQLPCSVSRMYIILK